MIKTAHTPEKCQDNDKTPQRARVRSGMSSVAYWRSRLFRNTYRDRQGQTVEIPEWYVRMRHDGKTKRVRLNSGDKDQAAERALRLFQFLQDEGWEAVEKRQARAPATPTVDEFIAAYLEATKSFEAAPRPITLHLYTRCLRQLCKVAEVTLIKDLNQEAVERFRDRYRAEARSAGRDEQSIQNTTANIIRNAAACFSREARAILERKGTLFTNPFENIRTKVDIKPVAPLPHTVVDRIWNEAHLLRDGDPEAAAPNLKQYLKTYRKSHGGRKPGRWIPVDFRKGHPEAYAALLMALGLGLRANEIDKARWSWFSFDSKGECYLKVRREDDFVPKGGTERILKVPTEVHEALVATRSDLSSPYVLGGPASTESSTKGAGFYRRMETIRVVNLWLRQRGVEADSKFGKPLHRLRKQFGSELATRHGIFVTQKLLGHSTPTITAKHYAALTELPTLSHVRLVG